MKRSITSTPLDTQPIQIKKIKIELDVGETTCFENDYEQLWSQLKLIASNLASGNQTEVNDIMFVLSQDPDKFTLLDGDYGDEVHRVIKQTVKLLYSNGIMDPTLSEYLRLKRNELINARNLSCFTRKSTTCDWTTIRNIAANLFRDFIFDIPKPNDSVQAKAKRLEFAIILSTNPSAIRNQLTSLELGTAKIEVAVAACTHILDGIKKHSNGEFRQRRNKMVGRFWDRYLRASVSNSDIIFQQVRYIVRKYWKSETDELQIDVLTILLIMDNEMIQSNYLLFDEADDVPNELFEDIKSELKNFFQPFGDNLADNKIDVKNAIMASVKEISMPIVARLKRTGYMRRFAKKNQDVFASGTTRSN